MIGVVVLAGCIVAVLAAGWIVYQLYAPQRRPVVVKPQRSLVQVIVEPAFAARQPPQPPRQRLARGTGATIRSRTPRNDRTERVEPMPFVRH